MDRIELQKSLDNLMASKPKKPRRPTVPKKPNDKITRVEYVYYELFDCETLEDVVKGIKDVLKRHAKYGYLDKTVDDISLSNIELEIPDCEYGIPKARCEITFDDEPWDYSRKKIQYDRNVKTYPSRLADYKQKMKDYKTKLAEWEAKTKELEKKILQERLKEL